MATQPTNLPVPSESPRDLKFNAGKIDEFVTSAELKYTDRFGGQHYTIEGLRWLAQQTIAAFGYVTIDSFEDGATLTLPNEVLRLEATGEYYRWDGAFPLGGKVVPPGSTPVTTGGVGIGAWLSVGDATLRGQLSSPEGATLVYNGSETVAAQLNKLLAGNTNIFHVDDFGAVGDWSDTTGTGTDDTAAFQAAFDAAQAVGGGKVLASPGKDYRITYTVWYPSNFIFDGQGCKIMLNAVAEGSAFLPKTFLQSGQGIQTTDVIFRNIFDLRSYKQNNWGNGFGMLGVNRILFENIGSSWLWFHLIDGCGGKNVEVKHCWSTGTTSAAFQADAAVGGTAVAGVLPNGTPVPCPFGDGTVSWQYTENMRIHNCYVVNAGFAAVHIHNYVPRRIFIHDNYFTACGRGVWSDGGGEARDVYIYNNLVLNCTGVALDLGANHSGLQITGNILYNDLKTVGLINLRGEVDSQLLRRRLVITNNYFGGGTKSVTVGHYADAIVSDNIFYDMGSAAPTSSAEVVGAPTDWALCLYGCPVTTVNANRFFNVLASNAMYINKGTLTATVSSVISDNQTRACYCALLLKDMQNAIVHHNNFVSNAGSFKGLVINNCVNTTTDTNHVTMVTNGESGIYILSGTYVKVMHSLVVGTTLSDHAITIDGTPSSLKTSCNDVPGLANKLGAKGTASFSAHEPFFPATSIINSGTGTITYNTFTTATK